MTAVVKIVSGGQTGADRGGLDAAMALDIPHGGWCPRGRRAEDGAIPDRYKLQETGSRNYLVRTEKNVVESDCTLVFTYGKPTGGSKKTVSYARKHEKPCLAADLDDIGVVNGVWEWLDELEMDGVILNVAGSRESKAPGIREAVKGVLVEALEKMLGRY